MKIQTKILALFLILPAYSSHADVGFTQQDLELVKSACLAGSSFEFTTEADGSISVKNLEGKGKLHVTKRSVDTVDLPDFDKKQEFNNIRACIKDYLMRNQVDQGGQANRAKQFGDLNESSQSNRRGHVGYGNQTNELYQNGNNNKSIQSNQ